MAETMDQQDPVEAGNIPASTLRWLSLLGDLAHVAVAILLIGLTVLVLIYACFSYAAQMPHLLAALQPHVLPDTEGVAHSADPFIRGSVEFLSNILFAVILLEVLHTTVIFLHDRSGRAVVRAFLVVAILSIVRKILLVGAESSLIGEMGLPFVYSSVGTLVGIFGIVLLVGGLVYMNRTSGAPRR